MGDRLYQLRTKADLNQEQLANNVNVSRQAVSKWERGESQPDTNNLIALSELYGVTIDYLVKGGNLESEASTQNLPEGIVRTSAETEEPACDDSSKVVESYPPPDESERFVFTQGSSQQDSTVQGCSQQAYEQKAHEAFFQEPYSQDPSTGHLYSSSSTGKRHRNPWMTFPYPLLVVILFLVFGFIFHAWNPAWVLFLTIPFYYWIASVIAHDSGDNE